MHPNNISRWTNSLFFNIRWSDHHSVVFMQHKPWFYIYITYLDVSVLYLKKQTQNLHLYSHPAATKPPLPFAATLEHDSQMLFRRSQEAEKIKRWDVSHRANDFLSSSGKSPRFLAPLQHLRLTILLWVRSKFPEAEWKIVPPLLIFRIFKNSFINLQISLTW